MSVFKERGFHIPFAAFISLFLALFVLGGAFFFYSSLRSPQVLKIESQELIRDIAANGSFEVQFSTAMETESTEMAFSLFPDAPGTIEWEEGNTLLRYIPVNDLVLNENYRIQISSEAKSTWGKFLETPYSLEYRVVSSPQISLVTPISSEEWDVYKKARVGEQKGKIMAESVLLKKGQPITVMFDRPIIALGDEGDAIDPKEYLEFSPEVSGEAYFLGTSAFEYFINEEKWPNATDITVTLKKGFPTLDGGQIETPLSWTIHTQNPQLLSVKVGDNNLRVQTTDSVTSSAFSGKNILPDSRVILEWNMPINIETLFHHLTIEPERTVKDDLIIQDQGDKHLVYLDFTPSLARNETITMKIDPGVTPIYGDRTSEVSSVITFSTLPDTCLNLVDAEGKALDSAGIRPGETIGFDLCSFTTWNQSEEEEQKDIEDLFVEKLVLSPEVDREDLSVSCYRTKCDVMLPKTPNVEYIVSFQEGLTDVFGQAVPLQDKTFLVKMGDYAPLLSPMTRGSSRGVHDMDEDMGVFFSARNVPSVDVTLCSIPADIVRAKEGNGGYSWGDFSCAASGQNVQQFTQDVPGEPNEMVVFEVPLDEFFTSEILFWEISSPLIKSPWSNETRRFSGVAYPVNTSLVAKHGNEFMTFWATDLISGKPVSDFLVRAYGQDGVFLGEGKTDNKGIISLEKPTEHDSFYAEGRTGNFFSYVGSSWDTGISPWDFDFSYDWTNMPRTMGVTFTDRPLYRPGDDVFFKAILRDDYDAEYFLPEDEYVHVQIENSRGDISYSEDLPLSDFATVSGTFSLPDSAPTGRFFLSVRPITNDDEWRAEYAQTVFWVEEYKKPVFKVDIPLPEKDLISGDIADFPLNASYFFGAPLPNADVSWHIVSSPLVFDRWSGAGWFSFGHDISECYWGCEEDQEVIAKGEGKTDAAGNLALSFPLQTEKHMLYTLRATVADSMGQQMTKSITFPVFSGDFILGVRSQDFWIDASTNSAFAEVVASDLLGEALSGIKFTATLQKVVWNSVKKKDVDGNYYWESSQEVQDIDVTSGTTGKGGKTEISFDLKNEEDFFGSLRILVESQDDRSNTVAAADSFWRSSQEYFIVGRQENANRFALHAEKQEVSPGENILLLPEFPFADPVPALITVERKGILFQEVTILAPGQPVSIEATEDMVPNIFVSVVLSKGKGLLAKLAPQIRKYHEISEDLEVLSEKITASEVKVDALTARLQVADLALVDPLEKGIETYEKELKQWYAEEEELKTEHKKVKNSILIEIGEDAAIPSLEQNIPHPEVKMGMASLRVSPEDRRLDIRILPEKESYIPGEEVKMTVEVQDSLGLGVADADLSVAVVDESLLALKSRQDEDIFETFFRLRNLGVQTAGTLTEFIHRLHVRAQKGEKGGGGLGGDIDLLKKKRGVFRDTAFWEANIRTDAEGEAEFSFTLPDNTTTWQTWVTAQSLDSQFGSEKENFVSQKPLLISPVIPRFFTSGDTVTIGMTVHNQTKEEMIVTPNLSVENATLLSDPVESFHLAAGKQQEIFVDLQVQEEISFDEEYVLLTFSALADTEHEDVVEISLPLVPAAVYDSFATSGVLYDEQNTAHEKVSLSDSALLFLGGVEISLASGILGNVSDVVSGLLRFPYGCAEQVASTTLPLVALLQLQNESGKELLSPEVFDTDAAVQNALQKLYNLQSYNGGFVFWEGSSRTYPYLSAYVLFTLENIRAAEYTVDEEVLNEARLYLGRKLAEKLQGDASDSSFADMDTRTFAAYAISLGGKLDPSFLSNLYERRFLLSSEGKAYLLLAASNTLGNDHDITKGLLKTLEQSVMQEDRTAYAIGSQNSWNFSSDIRATATTALALLAVDESHPLLPKLFQFLRDTKKAPHTFGGAWGNTQNTAWTLLAFAEWSKHFSSDSDAVSVFVNTQEIFTDILPKDSTPSSISVSSEVLRSGAINDIDISSAEGVVSYDVLLNRAIPVESAKEVNNGFGILHSYFSRENKKQEIISANLGDVFVGKTTLLLGEPRYFVGVTLPLPAGAEAINFTLENEDASLEQIIDTCQHYWCPNNDLWRFTHKEYRDDHVFLFADYLPAGRYEFEYLLRATTVGNFTQLPARAEEIYHPEVYGRTEGRTFEITK